jgi:hypothetical protein
MVNEIPPIDGVDIARFEDFAIIKASTRDELGNAINQLRETFGALVRVHADPVRF